MMTLYVAGVDEAGRGPIAGPVFAAAVVLNTTIEGLTDSKKLSKKKREGLFNKIIAEAKAYAIASADVVEIDQLNIRQASLLAMKRAVEQLPISPDIVQVDGRDLPEWDYDAVAIIKGDLTHACISAASILAKVSRDRHMQGIHEQYPMYGFDQHMGYPTRQHLDKLKMFGVINHHRKTFSPVKSFLM